MAELSPDGKKWNVDGQEGTADAPKQIQIDLTGPQQSVRPPRREPRPAVTPDRAPPRARCAPCSVLDM
jgi:hypothetical protein|eukprot:SAG25_NODE_500_length_7380_cov_16.363137_7_plen_68_part_00